MTNENHSESERSALGRRRIVAGGAAAALIGVSLPAVAQAKARTLKIGYLTTLSGLRANFGEADLWNLERVRASLKDGLMIDGTRYEVEIVVRDTQTDAGRAASLSSELVLREKCDLLLVQDSDAAMAAGQLCDVNGVPMISTMGPWQAVVFGRGSTPEKGFAYSFHFFFGADHVVQNYFGMWEGTKVPRTVGTLYFDNATGKAFADPRSGFPAGAQQRKYKEVNAGFFKAGTDDFSNQISTFKSAGAEILTGLVFANSFATLWKQAQQASYRPEIVTMAGAFLFASAVESLGAAGDGMSTEIWWSPSFPYRSSLTGQTAWELGGAWMASTGKQWTQPIGYAHALFEVGIAALKATPNPKDRKALRDSIARLSVDTVAGPVNFRDSSIKSVALTPLAGGQWRKTRSGKFPYELRVTHNAIAKSIPIEEEFKLLSQLKA